MDYDSCQIELPRVGYGKAADKKEKQKEKRRFGCNMSLNIMMIEQNNSFENKKEK
jgi:hypothetical protein